MAAYTIADLGTYWRNIESEDQTRIEWQAGNSYTYEVRRETATTILSNAPEPATSDYTYSLEHIIQGYAWNQEGAPNVVISPIFTIAESSSFLGSAFETNTSFPTSSRSHARLYNAVVTNGDYDRSDRRPTRILELTSGVVDGDSVGDAESISDSDLLITSFDDSDKSGNWTKYTVDISPSANAGAYKMVTVRYTANGLADFGAGLGGDYLYSVTAGPSIVSSEEIDVDIFASGGSSTASFPQPRSGNYDEDAVWDPDGGDGSGGWTTDLADLITLGGGRYGRQIVAIANKKIYFGVL